MTDHHLCTSEFPFCTQYSGGRHGLMLLWFADLMNVTEEVTIHRPNVSILLSSAFIRGDLNAEQRLSVSVIVRLANATGLPA